MNLQQLNKPITLSFKSAKKQDAKRQIARLRIALSLDIGSYNTKMLVGRQKANALFIEQAMTARTPENACADGAVADAAQLGSMLKGLISQDKTLTKDLVFSIESMKIIKREFIIPKLPDADIPGLITYEMGQYLPIDISEYAVQPKVIGSVRESGEDKIKVLANAVPKSIIQAYQRLFTAAGLKPVSMDLNPNSIEKLIQFDMENNPLSEFHDKNVVFIDMGHSRFSVSVYENGQYQFNRDIEIGGHMIDAMIANLLRIENDKAQKLKKEICGNINVSDLAKKYGQLPSGYQPQNTNEQLLIELLAIFTQWTDQTANVLQYMTRSRARNIDRIYLFGGSSLINGIGGFIESRLSIPVSAANVFTCCEFARGTGSRDLIITHMNALGTILRL